MPAWVQERKRAEKGSSNQPSANNRRFQAMLGKIETTNQRPGCMSKMKRQRQAQPCRTTGRWPGEEQRVSRSGQHMAKSKSTKYARGRAVKERSLHSSMLASISSSKRSTKFYELRIRRISETNTANKESMPARAASRKK